MALENIKNLFYTNEYLLSGVLKFSENYFWILLLFFTIPLICSIWFSTVYKFNQENPLYKYLRLISTHLAIFGSLGLFYFLMKEVQIAFLGAGFWMYFFISYLFIMAYITGRYFIYFYPIERDYYKETKKKK